MNIVPIQDVWFDDAATAAMGKAFDRLCRPVGKFEFKNREIIAKQIIKAAKNGERDPDRLYEQVLVSFGVEDMSMLIA
jgi:hypothetical protein